ncbi:reverse transcriptase domain-containing protein [Tanacetum coccineum]|uniref:Reverse transcriptase domain-containing protein n=1 Tax=Tanacetum coccineum TaxID=301880 RepID=A0ABQ5IN62_9ASTR
MAGSKTSSQGILLVIQAINHSWLWQRSTRGLIFYTKLCLKETQGVSITDCHAGNPCELPSDLTANNDLPIIEELYGQYQKERGKQVKGLEVVTCSLHDVVVHQSCLPGRRGSLCLLLRPHAKVFVFNLSFLYVFHLYGCMRTRSQARNRNRRQQQLTTVIVEEPEIPMADNRTMAQMLQAPIEGYEDAIVVPPINANNFELKQTLINLVQSNQFTGKQDPHNHLRFFNKVTSTFRHPEVPNTSIKLLLFPFSLEGEARTWLDKEPPRSILTWDDLVSKFINQFFPPSKTTYLRNKITTFYQEPNETFNEAWERFKELLRQCPHHGFSELHQLDTFYNSLNTNDQDALDSAAGGNFLDKMPRDGLAIIESKSKVRYSRSRAIEPRVL